MADDDYSVPVLPNSVAETLLREHLAQGMYNRDVLPKRCNPMLVDRILRQEAGAEAASGRHERAVDLCGLYTLRSTAAFYGEILKADSATRALDPRSQHSLVTIAALTGEPDVTETAYRYYDEVMLTAPDAVERFPVLMSAMLALGPRYAPGRLPDLAAGWLKDAEAGSERSDAAYLQSQELARNVGDTLPRALDALGSRAEIMSLAARGRMERMIRLYAQMDIDYDEELGRWASFELLSAADASLDARVALTAMFREAREKVPMLDLGDEEAQFSDVRLLRAIEHLAPATLTSDEQSALAIARTNGQRDLISAVQPASFGREPAEAALPSLDD